MSDETQIEWADSTWNPWEGCTKVSPGCTHCYAEARNHRFGNDNWGKGKPRRRISEANWEKPLKWNRDSQRSFENSQKPLPPGFVANPNYRYERPRIFPSLCDPFDHEVPIEWLADFLKLINETPNLNWLLLTKRPESWRERLELAKSRVITSGMIQAWLDGNPPNHVWMGVSVEDQQRADERIPQLLKIPATLRFLSVEPLLAPIIFHCAHSFCGCHTPKINWCIVGGESGPEARPCNVDWIRDIIRQSKAAGVPCFVKQLGAKVTGRYELDGINTWQHPTHRKGGDPSEWPKDLRVREFPKIKSDAKIAST